MRLAYKRYSGARGFTPDDFRETAAEVAGVDLKEWFRKALASTEELDYAEALDWFGLRFAKSDGQQPAAAWRLEIREDAAEAQQKRVRAWLGQSGATNIARTRDKPFIQDFVRAVISEPPPSLGVDPFYKKYTDALGIAILSSDKVPDAALLVARDIVIHMLAKRPDLRQEMINKKMRVGVMAQSELTTDIPEHRDRMKPALNDARLTPGERAN